MCSNVHHFHPSHLTQANPTPDFVERVLAGSAAQPAARLGKGQAAAVLSEGGDAVQLS